MTPRRILLRSGAVITAAALAMGLAGCGDVNAGTGAVDRLDALVATWDEVVTVDSESANNLPWVGEASATVVVDAETPNDRVEEMANELGAFLEDADGGTAQWKFINLQVDTFRVGVAEDEADREQRFSAFELLRDDDRVVGGFVRASDDTLSPMDGSNAPDSADIRVLDDVQASVRAIVADDVPLLDAFEIARSAADQVDDLDDTAVVAETEDGASGVTDSEGMAGGTARAKDPDMTLALATSIAAAAPVSDVIATSDALQVRLEASADVEAVRSTFDEKATQLGIDLTVNGGVVVDDGTAEAGPLTVAQSLDGVTGVERVEVTGSDVLVTVTDATVAATVAETVLAQPDIASVSVVSLSTRSDALAGFDVEAAPEDLARVADLVMAGSGQPIVVMLTATVDRVTVDIPEDTDTEALRALFVALRPSLLDGDVLSVVGARDQGFSVDVEFTIADEISPEVPRTAGDETAEFAARVASAWAAAF